MTIYELSVGDSRQLALPDDTRRQLTSNSPCRAFEILARYPTASPAESATLRVKSLNREKATMPSQRKAEKCGGLAEVDTSGNPSFPTHSTIWVWQMEVWMPLMNVSYDSWWEISQSSTR